MLTPLLLITAPRSMGRSPINNVVYVRVGSVTVPQLRTSAPNPDPNDIATADANPHWHGTASGCPHAYDRLQNGPNGDDLSAARRVWMRPRQLLTWLISPLPLAGRSPRLSHSRRSGFNWGTGFSAWTIFPICWWMFQVSEWISTASRSGQPATITLDAVQDRQIRITAWLPSFPAGCSYIGRG